MYYCKQLIILFLRSVKKVILPYIEQVKDDLDLPLKQKSLCIFDVFRAQISDEIMDFLKEKFIIPVMVPANCTDKLQPMDLSIQKPAKDSMKKLFQEWYTTLILNQYSDSATPSNYTNIFRHDLKLLQVGLEKLELSTS